MPADDRDSDDEDDRPPRPRRRDPDDRDDDDRDSRPRGPRRRYDEDGYEITSNDQMWALFAHIGVFVVGFLAPLIILFAYGDKSPFVKRHARESLNHQIAMFLYTMLALILGAVVGFAVYGVSGEPAAGIITGWVVLMLGSVALGIKNVIVIILATMAASRYEPYRYPFSIRLVGSE